MTSSRMLLSALLFVATTLQIQAQELATRNGVMCEDIASDADGNTYVCGHFDGFVSFGKTMLKSKNGSTDIFLAKFNKNGDNIWAVKAGGEDTDLARSLAIDDKGYVYVTGIFRDAADFEYRKIQSQGQADVFVARYNPSGKITMLKTMGGRGNDESTKIRIDAQNNLFVSGEFSDRFSFSNKTLIPIGSSSIYLVKMSRTGKVDWSVVIGNQGGINVLSDLDVDQAGNAVLCGSFTEIMKVGDSEFPSKGDLDGFAMSISSDGGLRYTKLISTEATDYASAIKADGRGNAVLVGHTSIGFSKRTGFVYLLDASGARSTSKVWDIGFETKFKDVNLVKQSDIVISGSFSEYEQFDNMEINCYNTNGFLIYCNSEAKPIWAVEGGGELTGDMDHININSDNQIVVGLNRPRIDGKQEQSVGIAVIDLNSELGFLADVGAAEKSELYDPSARYVDFKGKLLMGSESLTPMVESPVELMDNLGNVVERTLTDDYGDFVFHNLNVENEYNISAKEAQASAKEEPVFLANEYGMVLGQMSATGEMGFGYKVLPQKLVEIAEMEEQDPTFQIEKFLESGEKEGIIDLQIYYEPGASDVPYAYTQDLNTIARRIRTERDLKIEIASFTDAIGDSDANMKLSQKRADNIMEYLSKRKISDQQMVARGYGESGIINRCVDGVEDCSDQEHQANRRTEIRFQR